MIAGVFFGIAVTVVVFWLTNPPCNHENTHLVSKCLDCGKAFNDPLERMRGEK